MWWPLTEVIAQWQLATGTTLLEAWIARLGAWIQWVFAKQMGHRPIRKFADGVPHRMLDAGPGLHARFTTQ